MKRHITKLEEKLIEKGWYLTEKSYIGKYSQKVESYRYEKTFGHFMAKTYLDSKRENVLYTVISNMNVHYVGKYDIDLLEEYYETANNEVLSCLLDHHEDNEEVVQVVEALECQE